MYCRRYPPDWNRNPPDCESIGCGRVVWGTLHLLSGHRHEKLKYCRGHGLRRHHLAECQRHLSNTTRRHQPEGINPKASTRRHQPEGTTITVYALAFLAPDINDATDTAVCLDRLGGGTRNQNSSSPAAKNLIFTKTGICIEVSVPTEVGFLSRWRVTDTYTTTTAAHLPKVLLYCMSSLCNGWTSAPFPTIGCILQCTPGTERPWVIVVC